MNSRTIRSLAVVAVLLAPFASMAWGPRPLSPVLATSALAQSAKDVGNRDAHLFCLSDRLAEGLQRLHSRPRRQVFDGITPRPA